MDRKPSELEAKMSPASISRSDAAYRRLKQEILFQKFTGVSRHRLLTRAAPFRAPTVREWSSRDT
jgi:hypothetical protein